MLAPLALLGTANSPHGTFDILDNALCTHFLVFSGIHPVCTPCLNSAKLYQEEPQCEWGGSVKPEDGSKSEAKVKQEDDQNAVASNLPPLPLPSLNPLIASDASSYHSYDPSYGTLAYNTNFMGDQNCADGVSSSTSNKIAGKRKTTKRDHNSVEVEALLARVAELEAKLQAANMETSSQPSQGSAHSILGGNNHAGSSDSTARQAPHVHFQVQDSLPLALQNTAAGLESAAASSNASSVEITTGAGSGGSKTNSTSRQGTTTNSISPFSSNGLPTPPSSTSAATGFGGFPSSPASNASRGSTNQDGSYLASSGNQQQQQQQQQSNTSYFTKSSLGHYQDPKWNMGAIPGYLNMTPPVSQPQSPFGPGNLVGPREKSVAHMAKH